jgi:hypothetical protein
MDLPAPQGDAAMGCRGDAYDGRGPDCQENKANGAFSEKVGPGFPSENATMEKRSIFRT